MDTLKTLLQKYKKGHFLEKEVSEEIKKILQEKKLPVEKLSLQFKKEVVVVHSSPAVKHYIILHQNKLLKIINTLIGRKFEKIV